jgi:hypothetical protein
MTSKTANN